MTEAVLLWVLIVAIGILAAAQIAYVGIAWTDFGATRSKLADMTLQREAFLEMMKRDRIQWAEVLAIVRRIADKLEA